jgi:hypothetical protein
MRARTLRWELITMAGDKEKDSESGALPNAISVVGALIGAAADNPSVKAAGAELGKAAHTVAKTINIALLPLAALNFGYDRARRYFEERFTDDMEERLAGVQVGPMFPNRPHRWSHPSKVGYG